MVSHGGGTSVFIHTAYKIKYLSIDTGVKKMKWTLPLIRLFFNIFEKNSSPQKTQGVLTLKTQHHGRFFPKNSKTQPFGGFFSKSEPKNSIIRRIFRQNVNKSYNYFTKS